MIKIAVDEAHDVSGLLLTPPRARACYVFAHGAGAGMAHSFMSAVADGLFERGIATLRFQFPFMEQGSRRPDRPVLAQAAVRAAANAAACAMPSVPLFAGGKSFGGRMTSQAQAASPMPNVRGLIFLGFPLYPAGKPSDARALHLAHVQIPMLFLQGTRDALADIGLMGATLESLGNVATLKAIDQADHSFHVPKRSGQNDAQVIAVLCGLISAWIDAL